MILSPRTLPAAVASRCGPARLELDLLGLGPWSDLSRAPSRPDASESRWPVAASRNPPGRRRRNLNLDSG